MDRRIAVKNIALLLGLVVSGSTVLSLFNACSTDQKKIKGEFFDAADMYIVESLVDIILPISSSIGAKELNVSQFVDKMCKYVLREVNQKEIRLGIEEFRKKFEKITDKISTEGNREDYSLMIKTYFDISHKEQKIIFEMLGNQNVSEELKATYHLYKFLTTIREYTLLGYFTSKAIIDSQVVSDI
ncbi:gluconate 2-dehydrogenase subunit 3 family protein [Flavobacterium weaverense]|uniref:Gluconate 2-dehydrogenase subunit 3-like protein n=1 Tax=Flavobacterium weaverense TaxID=271156 RepID=A0A3L9ZJK6_9FLAO|nr:gluconate 2-dehydrogenase subunit 3 family protein [Flavobacterium weaverense]RMA73131.1 gluconate 2-dehydrogenase subunit 3-like protein [Flavobacterium weaverense]